MANKKEIKILLAGILGLAAFWVCSGSARALEPGSVQLDQNFPEKITDYLLTQPVIAGPFTGGKEADMEEILPFYTDPLTKYNLSVNYTKQSYQPGDQLALKGKISYSFNSETSQKALDELKDCPNCPGANLYRFPTIPDVGVFVQVWRKDADAADSQKGDYLVDEFYAAKGLNLTENEPQEFSINWQVPDEIKDGDYYLFLFVNSDGRFSLSGTPLVAFDQATTYDFQVANSEAGSGLELDKNSIKINNQAYVYRQPAPEVTPEDGKITVTVPLSNLSPATRDAKVTYNLFGWGQEDPTDLIETRSENKTIGAGDKSDLEYTFSPSETGSVYNLEIKAENPSSVSTANVRLVVKDRNRGIFRFLGQAKNAREEALPVFCLRNAAWESLFHGKVKINALDKSGKTLSTFEKEGSMRPEDRCFVISDRRWLADGNVTKLTAQMFDDNGVKVDEKTASLFSGGEKAGAAAAEAGQGPLSGIAGKLQVVILALLILVIVVGGYLILLRSKKQP